MTSKISTTAPHTATHTMTAAVIDAPGSVRILGAPLPEPGPGQVRVRLEGCGVCASNLPPWQGRPWFRYPFAPGQLGHEGWGRIDVVGDGVHDLAPGDRVAMMSSHAYAEYDVADAEAVLPLPASLDDQPVPGEPLGCAMNIFARSNIEAGQTVAIVGMGFLGALLTQLIHGAGAQVIAVGRRPFSLNVATRMGADHVVPMDGHDQVIQRVRELTGQRWCDVVIEATGKQWPLDLAGEMTRERGRLVIAGYHQDGLRQINLQLWNWRGLDVINAHERDPRVYRQGMQAAVRAIEEGRLDPAPLYTHVLELNRLGEALNLTQNRPEDFLKALVVPTADGPGQRTF